MCTLLVLLFSQEFLSDSYEDEVRKRLGLLKNKPMVTMASDSDASESMAMDSDASESDAIVTIGLFFNKPNLFLTSSS